MVEENNIFSLRLNILAIFIGRKIAMVTLSPPLSRICKTGRKIGRISRQTAG
jgi:hypothetical protein